MMKKTFKKVLATVLSATMVMSMATVSFAADPSTTAGSAHIFYNEVENVIVPSGFTVGLNPQGYEFTMPDTTTSSAQVMATTMGIVNKSTRAKTVTVKLVAQVSGTSGEGIEFKTSEADVEGEQDDLFVYLSAQPLSSGESVKIKTPSAVSPAVISTGNAIAANLGDVAAETTSAGAVSITTATDTALTFKLDAVEYALKAGQNLNLAELDANDLGTKFDVSEITDNSVTAFKITGALNDKAHWDQIGTATIQITPTYKVEDATGDEETVSGTANLVAGGSSTGSNQPAITGGKIENGKLVISESSAVITFSSNVTKLEMANDGSTYSVVGNSPNFVMSGKTVTVVKSKWDEKASGAKLRVTTADGTVVLTK